MADKRAGIQCDKAAARRQAEHTARNGEKNCFHGSCHEFIPTLVTWRSAENFGGIAGVGIPVQTTIGYRDRLVWSQASESHGYQVIPKRGETRCHTGIHRDEESIP